MGLPLFCEVAICCARCYGHLTLSGVCFRASADRHTAFAGPVVNQSLVFSFLGGCRASWISVRGCSFVRFCRGSLCALHCARCSTRPSVHTCLMSVAILASLLDVWACQCRLICGERTCGCAHLLHGHTLCAISGPFYRLAPPLRAS